MAVVDPGGAFRQTAALPSICAPREPLRMPENPVRIFVSSPADVEHERAVVKEIIERLAGEYLPYFPLHAVLWEEEALTADRTFQAGLTPPAACDIVLVILWTRLGTPLPQEPYRGMTGTEWEFVDAVDASADEGSPEVLVYKKTTPRLIDITDATLAREAIEDRRRLEEFFRRHFFHEDNSFRRAFRTFDNTAAFRELVETQLRKLLNRRISAERRASAGDPGWRGSPFRPGRPFDLGDERIFTGREQELRELLHRLESAPEAGGAPVLLAGPSGAGKTSLVRAGLLPRLARPFQFEQVASVRACLVEPLADGPRPLAAIARQLSDDAVLGEALAAFGLGAGGLERLLDGDPALAAAQIASALAPGRGHTGTGSRLLLVLDPLQPVLEERPDGELDGLGRALQALAAEESIWILGVLRSDALPALERLPALHTALQHSGWMTLHPPPPSRIRQVVEIPARIAGLDLDAGAEQGRGLVEQLEADASQLRLWPPPVQAVLEHAYRHARTAAAADGDAAPHIAADAYRDSGGLAGHLLAEADALWRSLEGDERDALPMLCRALITLDAAAGEPSLRAGSRPILCRTAAGVRLLERLIACRLAVAEGVHDPKAAVDCEPADDRLRTELAQVLQSARDGWMHRWHLLRPPRARRGESEAAAPEPPPSGRTERRWRDYRAVATFVHPVLISDWPPVRDWLAVPAHRRLLSLRCQLDRQAQLWKRTSCNPEYLLREAGYADAVELAEHHGEELEPLERRFIEQSRAHLRYLRRRGRVVRLVGAVLAALVLLSSITAGVAYRASSQAQANLSRSKLNEAELFIERGNTPQAVALALTAGADLPSRAVQTLGLAFGNNRLIAMAPSAVPAAGGPGIPGFDASGERLASFLPEQGPHLLRLGRGRFEVGERLAPPALGLHSLVIGADEQVFGVAIDGVYALPAGADAAPAYPCGAPPGSGRALDPSRTRLAVSPRTESGNEGICVLDLTQPGRVLFQTALSEGELRGISFSADGSALLTASARGRTHLVDLARGEITRSLPAEGPLGRPFDQAVFDPTGERIAIACADDRVRLYRRDGRLIAELSSTEGGGRQHRLHRSAVRDVAFGPEGAFLVAVDDEGQVVRWSVAASARTAKDADAAPARAQAVVLGTHRLSAGSVDVIAPQPHSGFSEALVLSASLDGSARIWGLTTGKPIAVLGHDAAITAARFSDDGTRVRTFSARDATVRLWSLRPVSRIAYHLRHPDHVWHLDMARSPQAAAGADKRLLLATAAWDGGVRVWSYRRTDRSEPPEPLATFEGDGRAVRQVRFSGDGRLLASAHYDGSARLYEPARQAEICRLGVTESPDGQVYNVLFAPQADWLLTTSDDPARPVRAYSSSSCEALDTGGVWADAAAPVEAAAVAVRGERTLVATGGGDGTLRLAEVDAGGEWRPLCQRPTGIGAIGDLALSPDGDAVAVAGEASHAALIELDGQLPAEPGARLCGPLRRLEGHRGRIYSIAFSPDSRRLLTASLDKTARLWNRDGSARAVLSGHQDRIYRAAFSPGGGWLLTASRDGRILVWQSPEGSSRGVEQLAPFLPLNAEAGGVANAAFSPDGQYIAGAYWENAAVLWRLWSEDATLPEGQRRRWGPERARLALVNEAYQFRRDNRAMAPEPTLMAEPEQ